MFNIDDDDEESGFELTHKGESLRQIEKFESPAYSDDGSEDESGALKGWLRYFDKVSINSIVRAYLLSCWRCTYVMSMNTVLIKIDIFISKVIAMKHKYVAVLY